MSASLRCRLAIPVVATTIATFATIATGAELLRLDFENGLDLTEETSGSGLNGVITSASGFGNITQSTDVPSVSAGLGSANFTQFDSGTGEFIEFLGAEFPDQAVGDDFSLSLWVKPSAAFTNDGQGSRGIVSSLTPVGGGIGDWQIDNGATVDGGLGDGSTTFTRFTPPGVEVIPGANVPADQWTQLSISFFGATNTAVIFTRDELSQLTISSTGTAGSGFAIEDLRIGANRGTGGTFRLYDGLVDEVVVTDTAVIHDGSGGQFELADLDFSGGTIDAADWLAFRSGQGVDLSSETMMGAYAKGDLDFDGDNDLADFLHFQTIFNAANGSGALATLLAVPEPSSSMLAVLSLVGFAGVYRRRRIANSRVDLAQQDFLPRSTYRKSAMNTNTRLSVVSAAGLIATCVFLSPTQVDAQITSATVDFDMSTDQDDFLITDGLGVALGDPDFDPIIGHNATGGVGGSGALTYDGGAGSSADDRDGLFIYAPNGGTASDRVTADIITLQYEFLADDVTSAATPRLGIVNPLGEVGVGGSPPPVDSLSILLRTGNSKRLSIRNSDSTTGANLVADTPGTDAFDLTTGNWYRMTMEITRTALPDQFDIVGSVFDLGATGTDTPALLRTESAAGVVNSGLYASGGFAGFTVGDSDADSTLGNVVEAIDNFSITTSNAPVPEPLTLIVSTDSGEIRLANNNAALSIDIDYLRITSSDVELDGGSLTSGAYTGLAGAAGFPAGNNDGLGWEAADNNDDTEIIESFLTGSSVITNAAGEISLGNAFVPGSTQDLAFVYHIAGQGAIETTGLVTYVSAPGLPGDFNADGMVSVADYTVWRDNLGSSNPLSGNGDESGDSAGVVDAADYGVWKNNYGASGASVAALSVPEPPGTLAALSVTCLIIRRQRHRPQP